jgi:hypothetical protein
LDDATLIDISFNFDSQHLALEVQKRAPDTGALFRDFLAYAKKNKIGLTQNCSS